MKRFYWIHWMNLWCSGFTEYSLSKNRTLGAQKIVFVCYQRVTSFHGNPRGLIPATFFEFVRCLRIRERVASRACHPLGNLNAPKSSPQLYYSFLGKANYVLWPVLFDDLNKIRCFLMHVFSNPWYILLYMRWCCLYDWNYLWKKKNKNK